LHTARGYNAFRDVLWFAAKVAKNQFARTNRRSGTKLPYRRLRRKIANAPSPNDNNVTGSGQSKVTQPLSTA